MLGVETDEREVVTDLLPFYENEDKFERQHDVLEGYGVGVEPDYHDYCGEEEQSWFEEVMTPVDLIGAFVVFLIPGDLDL